MISALDSPASKTSMCGKLHASVAWRAARHNPPRQPQLAHRTNRGARTRRHNQHREFSRSENSQHTDVLFA
ncbi:MAG: hypothetical protein Ta2A_24480 [Treponemataceae bacterium]|nr:MAG: hypothetical protein Ta2A_24480 [Treponemataceae bacterium]